jgi:threonine dehydrogenase-like Zn-dependent dehydrogenase
MSVCVVGCLEPKILKITISSMRDSNLQLYQGPVIELQKGDILSHELCGIIQEMGLAVKGRQQGNKVVASFQVAVNERHYCDRK